MSYGTLFMELDYLDVLESLEDNTFSLIYINLREEYANESKRINYDIKGERERYYLRIAQNCFRILKDNGVVVCVGEYEEDKYSAMEYALDRYLFELGTQSLDMGDMYGYTSGGQYRLIHFFAKWRNCKMPERYILQEPTEKNLSVDDSQEDSVAREKNYVSQVLARDKSLWEIDNYLQKLFAMFTFPGANVLGIDCPLQFMDLADKMDTEWSYIYAMEIYCQKFPLQEVPPCDLVTVLEDPIDRIYEEDVDMIEEFPQIGYVFSKAKKEEKLEDVSAKAYTVNEILLRYLEKLGYTDDKIASLGIVSRPIMTKIRKAVREYTRMHKGMKVDESVLTRSKNTIFKVIVYTNMPYEDAKRALESAGLGFDEGVPREKALKQWLEDERIHGDIDALNRLIRRYGSQNVFSFRYGGDK